MLAPHTRDHHMRQPQIRAQRACAPVRRAIRWRTPRCLQNARLQLRREHAGALSTMTTVQSSNALLSESLAPARHESAAAFDALRYFVPCMALRQQQNQPRTSRIFRASRPAVCSPRQFHTFQVRQSDRVCHVRDHSL